MLAGIADAHVVDMRSHIDAAVAVKWPAVIASTTYDNAQPRVREVGEALVVAGHRRARVRWRTVTMVATLVWQCGLTYACLVALAAWGGGVNHGRAMCEVEWVMVWRW